jgi:hypothetical protein
MKRRDQGAQSIEQDYLDRFRSALEGRDASEVEQVIQLVQEQIEKTLSQYPETEVSSIRMADILNRMGPPEDYAKADNVVARLKEAEKSRVDISGAAILSLAFALSSIFLSVVGIIPALICGHVARRQCARTPGLRGRGMALAGLIIGYVGLVLHVVVIIILLSG